MTTALTAQSCIYCGLPATEQHHFREDNPSQGKGMGGAHPHLDMVGFCDGHHRGLHMKSWVLVVGDGVARGFEGGREDDTPLPVALFTRPLVLDDDNEAPEFWSELKLCTAYVAADRAVMLWKGRIAAIFWARKRYNEDWADLAAKAITRHTGEAENVSARSVRRWANLWLTTENHFDGDDSWIDNVGRSVAYVLADAREWSHENYSIAVAYAGEAISQRATIRRLTPDNVDNRETCVCHCGHKHRRAKT